MQIRTENGQLLTCGYGTSDREGEVTTVKCGFTIAAIGVRVMMYNHQDWLNLGEVTPYGYPLKSGAQDREWSRATRSAGWLWMPSRYTQIYWIKWREGSEVPISAPISARLRGVLPPPPGAMAELPAHTPAHVQRRLRRGSREQSVSERVHESHVL